MGETRRNANVLLTGGATGIGAATAARLAAAVASVAAQNWQRRAAVIEQLLDTPDFASGLEWCRANGGLWEKDPYTFSKQCVVAWTYRATGAARAYGVRVNSVSPGGTDTRLTE